MLSRLLSLWSWSLESVLIQCEDWKACRWNQVIGWCTDLQLHSVAEDVYKDLSQGTPRTQLQLHSVAEDVYKDLSQGTPRTQGTDFLKIFR